MVLAGFLLLGLLLACDVHGQDTPPPTADESARGSDASVIERLRRGQSTSRAAHVHVVMPAQITESDLQYWSWLLGLSDESAEALRRIWEAHRQADDAFRALRLPLVFEIAAEAANPGDLTTEGAQDLCRTLVRERRRVLEGMRALERAMFENWIAGEFTEEGSGEELLSDLEALRLQDSDQANFDTLRSAKVDVGRFLFERRRTLSPESLSVVRACLLDAQPSLAELRRAHEAAFSARLGAGCKVMLARGKLARSGSPVPPHIDGQWANDRDRARRQLATAARRIGEANRAIIESLRAALPREESAPLFDAFLDAAYGDLARNPWDVGLLTDALGLDFGDAERAAIGLLATQYSEQGAELQTRVQRQADRYWVDALGRARPDRGAWERAAKECMGIHLAQRGLAEQVIALIAMSLAQTEQEQFHGRVRAYREHGEAAAAAQIEALEPRSAPSNRPARRPSIGPDVSAPSAGEP